VPFQGKLTNPTKDLHASFGSNSTDTMAKRKGNTSSALNAARVARKDEFFTQLTDIEKELQHYREQFRGKIVLCNCDDPYESNFFRYFALNFNVLGLKKLIASCYAGSPISDGEKTARNPCKIEISEVPENPEKGFSLADAAYLLESKKNTLTPLKGDGDFRSPECVELMKKSDIIVTNPPFSLFREFVAQLDEHRKDFLIIGNINAITCKEIFKLIKENKIWLGESIHSGDRKFVVPDHYPLDAAGCGIDENGRRFIRVKGVRWFTNIQTKSSYRHEELKLHKTYNAAQYPKYDNCDAIEVSRVVEIPKDYDGCMGVPITFLDKYNPKQFEILGLDDHRLIYPEWRGRGPELQGKPVYRRIIIRKKENAA